MQPVFLVIVLYLRKFLVVESPAGELSHVQRERIAVAVHVE
jgi:hypothetical protein